MNYAEIKKFDIANSPNVGSTVFFSGCTHRCNGCFNDVAKDFSYGNEWTNEVEDLFISYLKNPVIVNANLLGGEVFQQDLDIILRLVKRIKSETNVNIWCWTGYTLEELYKDNKKVEILKYIDTLIDGRFEQDKKNLMLKYRGSSNQRVIDMKETLKSKSVILMDIKEDL